MPSSSVAIDARLALACVLATLAGAVDAVAILSLGDVFVSFMSGNTTFLGTALAHLHVRLAVHVVLVILCFVAGVATGELLALAVTPNHRPSVVLTAVAAGLAFASFLARANADHLVIVLCLATSMGIQNATVRRVGGVEVALTYVTGTLVRLGRACAAWAAGRGEWRAIPPIASLWLAFAAGAVAGGTLALANTALAIAIMAVCASALALLLLMHKGTQA